MNDEIIKECVIKILEILSTADPARDAMSADDLYSSIPCQFIIDSEEVESCRVLLERIKSPLDD